MRGGVLLALLALAAASCFRPHLVDCVLACDSASGCPGDMTCVAGLCTRGPACVLDVAAGARHTCAIHGRSLQCWGNNSYGQLGGAAGGDVTAPAPVDLGPGLTASAVAAGGRHTCAVVGADAAGTAPADRNLVCWGDDSFGQLAAWSGVKSVSAGLAHTCAVLDDGSVRCAGDNRLGQLGGVGGGPGAEAVSVGLGGQRAKVVAAGAYHTCALLESGAVACWGWNDYGQLGNPDLPSGDVSTGLVVSVDFGSGRTARSVSAGAFHSCAILDEGEVTCWGQNDAGQIGVRLLSNQKNVAPGTPVDLGHGRTALAIASGASHTCALLDDFSVKCWGFNDDGELGLGDTANRGASGGLGDDLGRVGLGPGAVSRLSAGSSHTCAVQGADVKCWGLNDSGRLGTGDVRDRGDNALTHAIVAARLAGGP